MTAPNDSEPVQGLMSAFAAGWRQEKGDQGQEEEEARLRCLQKYICELLIENQQLRDRLEAAANQ